MATGTSPGVGMTSELPSLAESKLADAMALMQQALELLDESQAPPDNGAHLDLAIVRLGEALAQAPGSQAPAGLSTPAPIAASRSTG